MLQPGPEIVTSVDTQIIMPPIRIHLPAFLMTLPANEHFWAGCHEAPPGSYPPTSSWTQQHADIHAHISSPFIPRYINPPLCSQGMVTPLHNLHP